MKRQELRALAGALAMVIAGASLAIAQTAPVYSFDQGTFTINVPTGFSLVDQASPMPGYKTFGFVSASRADGTNGVMQVSLYDVATMGAPPTYTLDQFAGEMIASMQRGHTDWKGSQGAAELAGVEVKIIEWTGGMEPAPGVRLTMHGLMILGLKQGVGFRVEAQDVESLAKENLPNYLTALKTFTLTVKR